MNTDTISNHISTIQELAAELTEAQHDYQRLDDVSSRIHSIAWKLSLEIEDAPSRIARDMVKKMGKDVVTLKELAGNWCSDTEKIKHCAQMLRYYLRAGIIPGIHKNNRQWLCTKDTLAEYLRERCRQDAERRQRIAEREAAESLDLAA